MVVNAVCTHISDLCLFSTQFAGVINATRLIAIGSLVPLGALLSAIFTLILVGVLDGLLKNAITRTPVFFFFLMFVLTSVFYKPNDFYIGLVGQYVLSIVFTFVQTKSDEDVVLVAMFFLFALMVYFARESVAGRNVPSSAVTLLSTVFGVIVLRFVATFPFALPLLCISAYVVFFMGRTDLLETIVSFFTENLPQI